MDFWISKCFAQLCSRLRRRRHQRAASASGRSRHRQWRGGSGGGCGGGGVANGTGVGGGSLSSGAGGCIGVAAGMDPRAAMSRSLVHYGRMGPPAPLGSPEPLMAAHDFYDCCMEEALPPGK